MEKINYDEEWNFIITETHSEKSNKQNKLKRELLLTMQILLPLCRNDFHIMMYKMTKDFYLKYLIIPPNSPKFFFQAES